MEKLSWTILMGPMPLQLSLNVEEGGRRKNQRAAVRWTQPKIISFDDGEGAMRHRMQASSRSWKGQGNRFSPRAFGRKGRPASMAILVQWDPFQTSDLRIMRTDLHHLKSLNLWSFVTAEMEVRVAESNSCDPMDCGLPGSSVRGTSQARIPEWVAISF